MLTRVNHNRRIWILLFISILFLSKSVCKADTTVTGKGVIEGDTLYVSYDDCKYQYTDDAYLTLVGCTNSKNTHTIPENILFSYTTNDSDKLWERKTITMTAPVQAIRLNSEFQGDFVIPATSRIVRIDTEHSYKTSISRTHFVVYKDDIDLSIQKDLWGIEKDFTIYYRSTLADCLRTYVNNYKNGQLPEFHYMTAHINYVLNGGTNHASNPDEFVIYQGVSLKEPTRKDYTFVGWYTTPDFQTNTMTDIISAETKGDITIYAKWQYSAEVTREKVNYQITNDNTAVVQHADYQDHVTIDNTITYNGSEYPVTTIDKNAFTNSDITAVTIPENIRTIESGAFDHCDNLTDVYIYSMTLSLNDLFPKSIHLHAYADSKAYKDYETYGYTGERTAYGSRILYELNGGINSEENPETYNWKSYLALKDPQRVDFQFGGWYTDSAFQTESRIQSIYEDLYHDIVLYAKWIPLTLKAGATQNTASSEEQSVKTDFQKENAKSDQETIKNSDTVTMTVKPLINSFSLKRKKARKITIKIQSTNADGHQIKYSTNKKFSKQKTITIKTKKKTYTISNLKKGKTYYIKIRAYKKNAGKVTYGNWSTVKKVKIK